MGVTKCLHEFMNSTKSLFINYNFIMTNVDYVIFLYTGIYCTTVSSQTLQAVVALASVHNIEENKLLLSFTAVLMLEIILKSNFLLLLP